MSHSTCLFRVFAFLGLSVFLIYGNSFQNSWHLDDEPNILNNSQIHITSLNIDSLKKTFFAHPDRPGTLFRPISCLSFSLNWFFSKDSVFSYHLINIIIHFITAIILYYACRMFLFAPFFSYLETIKVHEVSLLAALFWALNPVQTQAVTYIVQRMAQLSALFYLLGILFYLKFRHSDTFISKLFFSLFCISCFFLSIGSKENSITFPLSLIILELIFFSHLKNYFSSIFSIKYYFYIILLIIISIILFVFKDFFFSLISVYDKRTFTLSERLLTQPRVLIFYLSLLFFPLSSRLSIDHNIELSKSLWVPWTTLPSILFCIGIVILAFYKARKWPLFSFAVLFFFTAHLVESTFLPLEIIFEHRNYLPSLFLYIPLSLALVKMLYSLNKKPVFFYMALSVIPVILIFYGLNTYNRNKVWLSEETLWSDALSKSPNSSRPTINLAKAFYKSGKIDIARDLINKPLNQELPTAGHLEALSLNALGVTHYTDGDYATASNFFWKSLRYEPNYKEAFTNLILSVLHLGKPEVALSIINERDPDLLPLNILKLQGIVLLNQYNPLEALSVFRKANKRQPLEVETIVGIGRSYYFLGQYDKADFYLRQTENVSIIGSLCSIENHIASGKLSSANESAIDLLSKFPFEKIFTELEISTSDPTRFRVNNDRLKAILCNNAAFWGQSLFNNKQ